MRKRQMISKFIAGLALVAIGMLVVGKSQTKSFFGLLGVQPSAISDVQLWYGETQIPLEEAAQARLLESLEKAQRQPKKDEPQGFRPSDYKVKILAGQQTYELQFYWFSGKRLRENGFLEYTDRRFDVEIRGGYYSFVQTEDAYWNEELCEEALKKAVGRGSVEEKYRLDGYDGRGTAYDKEPVEGLAKLHQTPAEIMAAAETVIIAEFTGNFEADHAGYQRPVFEVEDVWKTVGNPGAEIALQVKPYGERIRNGKTYIHEWPLEMPPFIKGERYLLCLCNVDGGYRLAGGICGSARIFESTTYPRYNTETHPFYQQNLAALKQQCQ